MIYAIQASNGPIKIGVAANAKERMAALQTGNAEDLRLLAYARVHQGMEPIIHDHLRADRLRGEWFKPTERVLEVIEAMRHCEDADESIQRLHAVARAIVARRAIDAGLASRWPRAA